MGVTRTELPFEGRFTQIPNAWLRDKRLSRKARGLLCEIMSHQVGWQVSIRGLAAKNLGPEGKDSIESGLKELRDAGYLVLSQARAAGGQFGEVNYELSDPFSTASGFSGSGSAASGFTASGKSAPKEDHIEEHHLEEHQPLIASDEWAAFELEAPGTRTRRPLPPGWEPTLGMRAWATEACPSVNIRAVTAEFVAYWRIGEGRGRGKKNWALAWRKWLLKEHEENVRRGWKPVEKKITLRGGRVVS